MRVLLYNIQLCAPVYMINGQMTRAHAIVQKIAEEKEPFDVLVFLEVFYHKARDFMIQSLKSVYPYHAELPRSTYSFVSGGVLIVSRHNITNAQHRFYQAACSAERLASKGFLVVDIMDPQHGPVRIIGTHLQAWDEFASTRTRQFRELKQWLQKHTTRDSKLFVLGDFNWDYFIHRPQLLDCTGPNTVVAELLKGVYMHTADNEHNQMRGLDGTAAEKNCDLDYYCQVCWSSGPDPGVCSYVCEKPAVVPTVPYCECCEKRMMDYAYVPPDYVIPTEFTCQVLPWKSKYPLTFDVWKIGWLSKPHLTTSDMSDHFPVVVSIQWPTTG